MDDKERQIRLKLKNDFIHYASRCLFIKEKTIDGAGNLVSFTMNRAQRYVHEQLEMQRGQKGLVRAIILKGRQQGMSTYIGGRFFHRVTHEMGKQAFILTHLGDATNNLFDMAKRFHKYCPSAVKPTLGKNNSKELIFSGLESGYKIGTAENAEVGRSATIQYFHGSEVAFWPNAARLSRGILQAVPYAPGTEVIFESTANGVGNYFHQEWQKAEAGKSDFICIFVPWFWQEEYTRPIPEGFCLTEQEHELKEIYGMTVENLVWRRAKIVELSVNGEDGEKAFNQEYPNCANEAFVLTGENNYLPNDIVVRARKCEASKYGPKVLGVDPARFGDDRTAFIRRQGRVAYGLKSYDKIDTMEIVGLIVQAHTEEQFDKIFVDAIGLGAGIIDRCRELGLNDVLVPVNAGSKPINANKYLNKRSEMWGEMREWLLDEPVQIPDIDSLHADLCGIKYRFDSNSRLIMEKKEDMKKRGIRSPDEADALCLTFAMPASALTQTKKQSGGQALMQSLAQNINSLERAKRGRYGNL